MKTKSSSDALCRSDGGIVSLLIGISVIAIIAACLVPVSTAKNRTGRLLHQPIDTKQVPKARADVGDLGAGDRSNGKPGATRTEAGKASVEAQAGPARPLDSADARKAGVQVLF
jgi:hypothetical protein